MMYLVLAFMVLKKSIRFLSVNIRDLKVTGLELRLFSLVKNAAYFYKLVKIQRFDWNLLKFNQHSLTLGRIDLCFCNSNDLNYTSKSFDEFLIDSRNKIQNYTTTRHIRLQDFPDGKILKVNRRNNSVHYKVYQKDQNVRFEIELKHRQTKLVQDYLFQNQLDILLIILIANTFEIFVL